MRCPGPLRRPAPPTGPGSWLAVASVGGRPAGFATARSTASPFPRDHERAAALHDLGVDRRDDWLGNGLEIVELIVAVGGAALTRGRVARAVLRVIAAPARGRRVWTVVDAHDVWLRECCLDAGWTAAGPVALLGPGHPTVRRG